MSPFWRSKHRQPKLSYNQRLVATGLITEEELCELTELSTKWQLGLTTDEDWVRHSDLTAKVVEAVKALELDGAKSEG